MSQPTSRSDGNNPAIQSTQNKAQLLEATMRNVPKLKELNYTQWKNVITNSIKNAKLWGYVDGSIEQPPEENNSDLAKYFDEAGAVRNAILGSLEPRAQLYIEEELNPRDAWLMLEKKYLTAEAETDAKQLAIEKQLADLRLEEGGDIVEHIAEFCRMRTHLNGTRFALDDVAGVSMLYRSLPPTLRRLAVTADGTEMKDLNSLCARLNYLSQHLEPEVPIDNTPSAPVEDYSNWGVPEDIKSFGITGDKNPLLEERAAVTCHDCLLKGHQAGTPDCPQYEWRKELWGTEPTGALVGSNDARKVERPWAVNTKRLSYEFSEPVKVILEFDELGLKQGLKQTLNLYSMSKPWAIQQSVILPIMRGRNVFAQAPPNSGKSTALAISVLQAIDTALPHAQALVFTSNGGAFQQTINNLGSTISVKSHLCASSNPLGGGDTTRASFTRLQTSHIFVGTPDYILGLVRRNIINMHKLRVIVLDDIDKLIEGGMEDQILEVYRHVPPLTQVVASSTLYSLAMAKAVVKLLADPLEILVSRDEGISIGTHFYVKVPVNQKFKALGASFSALGERGIVVLCRDFTEIYEKWGKVQGSNSYYFLRDSMSSKERESTIQSFTSTLSNIRSYTSYNSYNSGYAALIATDTTLSTTTLLNISVPLVDYDIPDNVEDYLQRLNQWRIADPGQRHTIITFVTADTDEIHVIQDLERYYGVHVAELLWNGSMLY